MAKNFDLLHLKTYIPQISANFHPRSSHATVPNNNTSPSQHHQQSSPPFMEPHPCHGNPVLPTSPQTQTLKRLQPFLPALIPPTPVPSPLQLPIPSSPAGTLKSSQPTLAPTSFPNLKQFLCTGGEYYAPYSERSIPYLF
jgi:hypothetical protein